MARKSEKLSATSIQYSVQPAPSVIDEAICDKLSKLNKDIKFYEEPLKKLKEQKAELIKWCKDNGMTILGEQ